MPRPTAPVPDDPTSIPSASQAKTLKSEQKTWDVLDCKAKIVLGRHIESSIMHDRIKTYPTAAEQWNALMRHYHRRDAGTFQRALKGICDIRYSDTSNDSIADHLAAFERSWNILVMCTSDGGPSTAVEDSLETTLKVMARSEEVKAAFLISSLPPSVDEIVLNLRLLHGQSLMYLHVYRRLSNLHEARELQNSGRARDQASETQDMDCTWCRSRGYKSTGHTWKRSYRLSQFNKEKARNAKVL